MSKEQFIQQGDAMAGQGRWDEALEEYHKALKVDPADVDLRKNIAGIAQRKGDYQEVVNQYMTIAQITINRGQPDEALKIYQEVLNLEAAAEKKSFLMGQKSAGANVEMIRNIVSAAKGEIYFNMGYIFMERGALDDAVQYLKASLDLSGGDAQIDARIHTVLGQAYMKKGMDKDAIGEFQEVVRLAPNEAAYAYEMLGEIFIRSGRAPQTTIVWFRNAGELYLQNDQRIDAIRVYERILSFEPKNKDVLSRLGEIYAQQGAKEQAVVAYKRLAQIYTDEGLFDKVIVLYEKLIDWDPENIEARDKVIEIYKSILQRDPSNLSVRLKLIGNLMRKGSAEEAVPEFLSLANAYLEKGMLDEALQVSRKLLDIDPQNVKAHEVLGEIYLKKEMKEEALPEFMLAVDLLRQQGDEDAVRELNHRLKEIFPDDTLISERMADSLKDKGDYEGALQEIDAILAQNPDNLAALINKSEMLIYLERFDEARDLYQRILQLDPENTKIRESLLDYWLNQEKIPEALKEVEILSKALEQQGDYLNAERRYRQIMHFLPADENLRSKVYELRLAQGDTEWTTQGFLLMSGAFQRRGDFGKALEYMNRVVETTSVSVNALLRAGKLAQLAGHNEEAVSSFTQVADVYMSKNLTSPAIGIMDRILELDPGNVSFRERLIELLVKQLRVEDATEHYKQLMKIYLKDRQVDQANRCVREVIALQPLQLDLRVEMSSLFFDEGFVSEGQALLEELVKIYTQKDQATKVVDIYEKMARIAIGQGNWDNYWTLKERIGDLYMSEGRGAEAFDEYRRIAKGLVDSGVGERTSRFFDKFANLYVEAARTEDALAELEEMETSLIEEGKAKEALFIRSQRDLVYEKIEQWPKALEILRSLTLQYQELDDYDSAISALERSVMIRSNTGDRDGALSDQLVMAGLYLKDDDILKARSIFQKLRDELPGSFDVSFRMAEIYFKFEYYDESLPIYLELLEQRPQADEVVSRLAILYARAGELTCAARFAKKVFSRGLVARIIDEYKKAAHYQEANADSHLNMGLFYQEMGFMEEAVLEFQKAAKAPAKLLTAYRLLAQCFRRQGFDDLALRQFQRGLDQPGYSDEETLDLRYHMALTLQEMGRFDEALAALEECYSVDIKYRDVQDRIEEINAILSNKPPGDVIPFETRGSHRQEPDEDSPEALYTEAQADPMEPSSEPSGELFEVYRETGLPELAGEIPELPEEPLEESDSLS